MRSKIADRIMAETPEETKRFVRKYGDIVMRVHQLLKERGITQQKLADQLGKSPSEISKWLKGEHNFTLKSLTKLEAELGADIFYVPKKDSYHVQQGGQFNSSVAKAEPVSGTIPFTSTHRQELTPTEPVAA